MKLRTINLDENEDLTTISVDMTIEEACWMAKVSGAIANDHSKLHHEIYSCLVGGFFNKFYEDGVNEALHELNVALPKNEDIRLGG